MKEIPEQRFPRDQYPEYFKFWDSKEVSYGKILQENAYLAHYVLRVVGDGNAEFTNEGKIKLTYNEFKKKIVNQQMDQLNQNAKEANLGLDGQPRIG